MLHIVNYSFSEIDEAKRLLARLGEQDILLFIESGVFSLVKTSISAGEIESRIHQSEGFALSSDLAARGITVNSMLSGIRIVDYSGFVRLAVEHGPVQSWFR